MMTQHLSNLIAISIMFLPGPIQLKKNQFLFYFSCVLFEKLEGDRLMTQHLQNLIAIPILFLPGPIQLKKLVFIFIFYCVLFKKLEEDRLTTQHLQNLIAIPILFLTIFLLDVVRHLRNHGKYSPCWIDFVCDEIAHSLME